MAQSEWRISSRSTRAFWYARSVKDIVRVTKGDTLYALIVRRGVPMKGAQFLTPETAPFQLGLMEHPKGHTIRAHSHPSQQYDVHSMSEFLYLERGSIRATVYDEQWSVLTVETLCAGDALLLLAGGHAFEVLEDCRMFEVKQGPYPGESRAKTYQRQP